MSWYRVTLNGAQVAAGEAETMRAEFESAFVAARGPRTMALFRKEREDGGAELYATPEAGEHAAGMLERWGCSRCDPPALLGLALVVGHNEMTYY